MSVFKRFGLAVSYVTCIHLARLEIDQESTSPAGLAKYLPAVGVLIGGLLVALAVVMNFLENEALLQGCLIALTWLWLTGGLHFDGLMDTADGIFSHQDKERILAIMHDSRVGNFGVLAGVSILLLKIVGITSLHGPWQLAALACTPAWSRWCESYAIGKFDYARAFGKGKIWHDTINYPADLWKGAIPAVLVTGAAAYFCGATTVICPLLFTIAGGVIAAHWLDGKIDGHTGDTYGCVVELAEAAGIALSAVVGPALF